MNEKQILDALRLVEDPDLKKDIVTLGMVRNVHIQGDEVTFTLFLTTPACPMKDMLKKACTNAILKMVNANAKVNILLDASTPHVAKNETSLENVKTIFAVYSAKGGVGKSTIAASLALSLATAEASVGLLDVDIYGPSIPVLFDIENPSIEVIEQNGKNKMIPFFKNGIHLMSLGFLTQKTQAAVWRGPMASTATKQLLYDVQWPNLDYLIIDMPPGTGDVHLTIMQSLKLSGAIVVTTPHPMAIEDTRRAIAMMLLESINVPIVGLVENMSYLQLHDNDEKHYVFGKDGGKQLAEEFSLNFLGQIPLHSSEHKMPSFSLREMNNTRYQEAIQQFTSKVVRVHAMRSAKFDTTTIDKMIAFE